MTTRLGRRLVGLAEHARLPGRTVRLRLTLLYGGLFLVSGAALLAITNALERHATGSPLIYTGPHGAVVGSTAPSGSITRLPNPPVPGNRANVHQGLGGLTPQKLQAQAHQLLAEALYQQSVALHQLLIQSAIALAIMAVISIALGWIVAGRVLRPLRTISTAARRISATSLGERLAMGGPNDELRELADTFDGLLGRLEASFRSQRQFVANASHELRTPLARQRTLIQVALADPGATTESLRTAHERVLAAGAQQERLIEALLTLTRGHAGLDKREPFDLAAVTGQVLLTRRAEAKRRGLDLHTALSPAPAAGNPRLVERLVANLVDNALRYNVAGGRVDVRTAARNQNAILSVANTGPVIPATAVARLFQPFQRFGADRTGRGEGLGLGLSIVQAIADAHDATLTARPQPGGGLRIDGSFPAPAARGDGMPAPPMLPRANGPLSQAPAPSPTHGAPQRS